MPFMGIGLHVVIAVFFAIHVVRTGQPLFWLFVLFSFPLLGSAVYLFAVYLPNSRMQYGARKVVSVAARSLDPTRELRDARAAFDYTPTAQNRMRLAAALLDNGQAAEAADHYEACLRGPFAADPEMRLAAARAALAAGRAAVAVDHLQAIREGDALFRPETVALLLAQSLNAAGRATDAGHEFESATERFASFACYAEYAIWAAEAGQTDLAARLRAEADRITQRWDRHTRELNRPLMRRLDQAFG
jgi:hypothetical protein